MELFHIRKGLYDIAGISSIVCMWKKSEEKNSIIPKRVLYIFSSFDEIKDEI